MNINTIVWINWLAQLVMGTRETMDRFRTCTFKSTSYMTKTKSVLYD